jgi:hypothetical protein
MKKGFYYIEINKQGKSSISKAARLLDSESFDEGIAKIC